MAGSPKIPLSVVINGLGSGGAEAHLLGVLPRLDAARFDVSLFPLRSGGALEKAFLDRGVRLVQRHRTRAGCLARFAGEVRTSRPLVHCFLPEAYLLGGVVALMQGASALIMSRRSRNHYQSRHPLAARVERRLHRRMDALVGNSRAVVRDLLDEGAPADRVRLIYNGIDAARFAAGSARRERRLALRSELGLPDDSVVVTCVANLFPYKGHADIIDALALLGRGPAGRTTLLLAGRDAGARALLEARAAQSGLMASIRFLGERSDVPDLLAASDIGVLASHEEGFSNAVLEGMAAGLPMVVSDVGGNAEAVADGECGYVVPPRDPAALALALGALIDDQGRRRVMGDAARRRVVAAFSLDACVADYEALYEELWDRRRSATAGGA